MGRSAMHVMVLAFVKHEVTTCLPNAAFKFLVDVSTTKRRMQSSFVRRVNLVDESIVNISLRLTTVAAGNAPTSVLAGF